MCGWLRLRLDFMPVREPERRGLLVREPFRFWACMLMFSPQLVPCLACFDGEQTTLDLRESLVRITGQIQVGELEKNLSGTLSDAGFLENEKYEELRSKRTGEFATASTREPSHAGSAYPDNAEEAAKARCEFMQGARLAGTE